MRIAICGPQNTGKSTLITDLVGKLPGYHTPAKTYRDAIKEHNLPINQLTTIRSQTVIRDFLFDQLVSNRHPDVLFDRCLVDNVVYSQAANLPPLFVQESLKLLHRSLEHLDALIYIPTALTVKLAEDSVRDINVAYIDQINRLFIQHLFDIPTALAKPILVVAGSREQRVNQIADWLGMG